MMTLVSSDELAKDVTGAEALLERHQVWNQDILKVIGTDCIGSCKSNYHMITATTVLIFKTNK
jgi:hypothetical protein